MPGWTRLRKLRHQMEFNESRPLERRSNVPCCQCNGGYFAV